MAEELFAADARLLPTLMPPPKVNCLSNYTRLVAETGIDYFDAFEHAASWLGATELGYTVVWATLKTVQRLNMDGSLALLLNRTKEANAQPVFNFTVRQCGGWMKRMLLLTR